jgi:hypothetical protein
MGAALGKPYSVLFHEITVLHLFWKEYLELFGTNDKRIERLNRSAPGFFQMLQEQLFEANMAHLARLTDSASTFGKDNLSVRSLPDLVSDQKLKNDLLVLVEKVKQRTAFCRDWRNRRFAHHDLLLATQDARAKPLEDATKEKFADALQALSDLMNAIERFYYRGSCSFRDVAAHNGACTLLYMLGHGIRGRDEMLEKINKGDFSAAGPENV